MWGRGMEEMCLSKDVKMMSTGGDASEYHPPPEWWAWRDWDKRCKQGWWKVKVAFMAESVKGGGAMQGWSTQLLVPYCPTLNLLLPSFTKCKVLGKSLSLPVLQFPRLQNRNHNIRLGAKQVLNKCHPQWCCCWYCLSRQTCAWRNPSSCSG